MHGGQAGEPPPVDEVADDSSPGDPGDTPVSAAASLPAAVGRPGIVAAAVTINAFATAASAAAIPPPPIPPVATAVAPAPSGVPRPKRVTFVLEASVRCRNAHGADVYSQILWMRLDGVPVGDIAAAIGCSTEVVQGLVDLWQSQIETREGGAFQPRMRNRRRWGHRRRPTGGDG